MRETGSPHSLSQLLEFLTSHSRGQDQVTVESMLEAAGRRSFGPALLLVGLIPASPLSGIPGIPTICAILAFSITLQLIAGRDYFWQPQWVLRRSIERKKFVSAINAMHTPAQLIDRFCHPRLEFLTRGISVYIIGIICACMTLLIPPLELIPFANTISGLTLIVFGLALISHDGLLALVGTVLSGIIAIIAIYLAIDIVYENH